MRTRHADRGLDRFIAVSIMDKKGAPFYTSDITHAWQVVERMIRKYRCELKLDMFLGTSGELWMASFYSPVKCLRYESKARTAPLAICLAAKVAYTDLIGG